MIGHAGFAQSDAHQPRKSPFGSHIVREDQDAAAISLEANSRIGLRVVMSALVPSRVPKVKSGYAR